MDPWLRFSLIRRPAFPRRRCAGRCTASSGAPSSRTAATGTSGGHFFRQNRLQPDLEEPEEEPALEEEDEEDVLPADEAEEVPLGGTPHG